MYDNTMYTYDNSAASSSLEPGAVAGILLFTFIIVVAAYVINSVLWAQIFKKAGVAQWKAWVPVYSQWITYELGGQKGYWAMLALVPVVNIVAAVFLYIAMYNIGLKLGKEGAFVLLAIFLPIVWLIWLAVDGSTWAGNKPQVEAAAPSNPATTPAESDQPETQPQHTNDKPPTPPVA